jgi:DNA-binding protein HU-beta
MRQTIFRLTALLLTIAFCAGAAFSAARKNTSTNSGSAQKTAAKKQPAAEKSPPAAKKSPPAATKAAPAAKSSTAAKKSTAPAAKKSVSGTKSGTAAKRSSKSSKSSRGKVAARTPSGPSLERIREIQAALAKSGHYQGALTGRVDAATTAALSRFQHANDLEATGKIGVKTLKGLEKYGLPATTYTAAAAGAPAPEAIKP